MAFAVATPVFEGPFDLLLHLILREQVDIYEVSLSRIVDAYLAEIERLQVIDLDVATEFLLIAATLLARCSSLSNVPPSTGLRTRISRSTVEPR